MKTILPRLGLSALVVGSLLIPLVARAGDADHPAMERSSSGTTELLMMQLMWQQNAEREATQRVEDERRRKLAAIAKAKALEQARIKAQQDENWRQTSKDMMQSFSNSPSKDLAKTGTPEAPWGFGQRTYAGGGLPPQPDGASFITSDGQVRSVGYTGGYQAYTDRYLTAQADAGSVISEEFFDRDPAVVTYDSLGQPIGSDGFVVEYQTPAEREAAIIESRQNRVQDSLQNAVNDREFQQSLDRLNSNSANYKPGAGGAAGYDSVLNTPLNPNLTEALAKSAQMFKGIDMGSPTSTPGYDKVLKKFYGDWQDRAGNMIKAGKKNQ